MLLIRADKAKFRCRSLAMFLTSLFMSLSLQNTSADAAAFDFGLITTKREEVRIPLEPGVELIGTLYHKRSLKSPAPLVILLNPWSIGSWVYATQSQALADKGFVVLAYNLRGWAGSTGEVANGGPQDIADVSSVIDWASKNPLIDTSRVGIGGVSLGAGVALIAAAYEPRIKAVASMSTWTDFFTPVYGNNTKRVYWDTLLYLGSFMGTGNGHASKLKETYEAIENGDFKMIHDYTDPRTPMYMLDLFAAHKPAVLLSQNMSDILFPVTDVWKFYEHLHTPKKMNLQPGIHATAELTGMFLPWKDKVWDDAIEWFERWLSKNPPDHMVESSEVQINLPDGKTFSGHSTSELIANSKRFYLTNDADPKVFGSLAEEATESGDHGIENGKDSGVSSGLPILGALVKIPLLNSHTNDKNIKTNKAAIFQMKITDDNFRLLGIPRIQLKVRVEGEKAELVTHIFRVDSKGKWQFISMTPYTLREFNPAEAQTIAFDLYGAFAQFKKGDRLVIAIDTYDPEFQSPKNDFHVELEGNGESYIDLPIGS